MESEKSFTFIFASTFILAQMIIFIQILSFFVIGDIDDGQ